MKVKMYELYSKNLYDNFRIFFRNIEYFILISIFNLFLKYKFKNDKERLNEIKDILRGIK